MIRKTINHKGKLLHAHRSGFYIDLQATVEFAQALVARIDARWAEREIYIENKGGAYPKPETCELLVLRGQYLVLEDGTDLNAPWQYDPADGKHWVCGVEISFNEWLHGDDVKGQKASSLTWRELLGKRVCWALPFSRSPLYGKPLESDWFPMEACYSPARIALENMK